MFYRCAHNHGAGNQRLDNGNNDDMRDAGDGELTTEQKVEREVKRIFDQGRRLFERR